MAYNGPESMWVVRTHNDVSRLTWWGTEAIAANCAYSTLYAWLMFHSTYLAKTFYDAENVRKEKLAKWATHD